MCGEATTARGGKGEGRDRGVWQEWRLGRHRKSSRAAGPRPLPAAAAASQSGQGGGGRAPGANPPPMHRPGKIERRLTGLAAPDGQMLLLTVARFKSCGSHRRYIAYRNALCI